MTREKIYFYLLCIFTVAFSLIIFKIQFAILFVSFTAIVVSFGFAVFRFGIPPIRDIYLDFKKDIQKKIGIDYIPKDNQKHIKANHKK